MYLSKYSTVFFSFNQGKIKEDRKIILFITIHIIKVLSYKKDNQKGLEVLTPKPVFLKLQLNLVRIRFVQVSQQPNVQNTTWQIKKITNDQKTKKFRKIRAYRSQCKRCKTKNPQDSACYQFANMFVAITIRTIRTSLLINISRPTHCTDKIKRNLKHCPKFMRLEIAFPCPQVTHDVPPLQLMMSLFQHRISYLDI